ncbi:hypothetical protein [Blastochloris sulfoviridis]|uniref:Uncharacterized protein n=1 Tax=Blastochloris sulfoviridis TaxID=50712 RepID=A0A5M6HUA3_9HYPH|nr:hypothetical protein [Blastochloris sulfoviridis]KAA5599503.1 hypothetical protein F1193_12240 [Blastochloris sulfoviridis]
MAIRHVAIGRAGILTMLALLLAPLPAVAQAAGWSVHRLDAAGIAVPSDWKVTRVNDGKELDIASPDGSRRLLVWWWFPDEPLLGYPDIVSHRKVTVAGQGALYIHTRGGPRDTVTVTLDKGRKDKRRLHFLYEADGDLGQGDPVLDDLLSRVTIGGAPAQNPAQDKRSEAAPGVPAPAPAVAPIPAPVAAGPAAVSPRRVWLGRFSIEPPAGWSDVSDRSTGAVTLARPDSAARIDMSLLPAGEPMPSEGLEEVEQTVIADRPATRLLVRGAGTQAVFYIFDEPDTAGARLTLVLTAVGEVAGALSPFERVAESLRAELPPPAGTAHVGSIGSTGAAGDDDPNQDPFAGLDLD